MISACLMAVGAQDESAGAERPSYEAAAASAGRDARAHVDLALWCEARGMAAERARHLARAVLLDPEDARARGLLGQVQRDGRWMRPADVVRSVEDSPEQQAVLREYFDRRARAGDKADDQYKLALWCEEAGLKEPMAAHLRRTLQLDPGREGAWRRLGFKKVGGRWVNPDVEAAMKAEREAQAKADRSWRPRLERLRDALAGKDRARQAEARLALESIADPRAVPALFHVFAKGGVEPRQAIAVDALGRIEGAGASIALASLALYSPHPAVRSDAAALLQRRDPREFAGFLAVRIQDEVKYKVKPVGGPGSQGELLVEGKDANVRRIYRPMQNPQILPGDQVGMDENGNVVLDRPVPGTVWMGGPVPVVERPTLAAQTLERGGVPSGLARTVVGRMQQGRGTQAGFGGFNFGVTLNIRPLFQDSLRYPLAQMTAEARASALIARDQLAADVAGIEAHNAPIRETNERAIAVLKAVSGEDLGKDRERWMDWVLDLQGYGQPLRAASTPPADVVEEVPIAFQPQAAPVPTMAVVGFRVGPSCFAGGTLVRTLQGDRPIETVRPGDQVLSQDVTTGRLSYRPVVEALHNPPNWTYAVDLGKEVVHPTGIHRFWKAGHGWVMARDVRPGDRLRTVGGVVEVVSAEKEKVQPVFNLLLADGDSYHVGSIGLLAHDNGFVEPVAAPFDAVPATARLAAAVRP